MCLQNTQITRQPGKKKDSQVQPILPTHPVLLGSPINPTPKQAHIVRVGRGSKPTLSRLSYHSLRLSTPAIANIDELSKSLQGVTHNTITGVLRVTHALTPLLTTRIVSIAKSNPSSPLPNRTHRLHCQIKPIVSIAKSNPSSPSPNQTHRLHRQIKPIVSIAKSNPSSPLPNRTHRLHCCIQKATLILRKGKHYSSLQLILIVKVLAIVTQPS